MANTTPINKEDITIKALLGKKTTTGGKDYWQVDTDRGKYRVWDRTTVDSFIVGNTYKCDTQEYGGTFTDEHGKTIDYKLKTIINIITGDMQQTAHSMTPVGDIPVAAYTPRDFVAEARGKVRNSVAVATIGQIGLVDLTEEIQELMDDWVTWIMDGKNE